MSPEVRLRPFAPADTQSLLDLWTAGWTLVLPSIDFAERRPWMEARLHEHLAEGAAIVVAEADGRAVGFVVFNSVAGYLDQIAVAPEAQGTGLARLLLDRAKAESPDGLSLHVNVDNPRAVRFYEREGLRRVGEGTNPRSGLPIYRYRWP
ncbi:MAG: GNAT family N-acetyltransferase [Burkholderiales bacterium]|nr:GNAT family N-acetyltransferase [Burkholderiales bacterium]